MAQFQQLYCRCSSFQTTHTTLQKFACSLLAGIANETEEGATSIVIDGGRQIIERAKRQHANEEQVRTPADLILDAIGEVDEIDRCHKCHSC